ncbi:glyoxylase-like metal-dependent hydrolase (beta-lactamase superfamily II) [Nocardioides ginsengisegetis]|uniref:Glyoxylase-like metal-dependent hydrolase (Beta-lactamase superfamily II) n=1 Tax=Nocardioides ginsengisegetis TaxID=661491 RepID=A0A7W3J3U8_9ACTN|nr:glyoxylase-like metal-dependent hydrolase (beta-lactamase superfamily II) [Nocardioides ginsengisegetis]
MTIHHLNCATLRPHGSFGGRVSPAQMVAHCLLVERPGGLLLVDSGFGTGDIADPRRLGRPFTAVLRPALNLAETAQAQVRALGHAIEDVTDIALTHLDLDHAGGLGDFPGARVHVFGAELDAALHPTMREKARYIGAQWAHGPQWTRHDEAGDDWFGFRGVTALGEDVVLVPLHGHTRGHCGVAVRRPDGGWLLHAGDSYFHTSEKETPPSPPVGLRAFQTLMAVDNKQRKANQERLRELHAAHGEITIFSAHDASEYAALAGS